MDRIKVSADLVLSILKGIMEDEELNYKIEDTSAPVEWISKTVQDALNIEYYTYKHRAYDTAQIVSDLLQEGKVANSLYALERSFCLLYLENKTRVFSKDNDTVTVTANLEYWVQSSKVKLLEDLIEDMTVATIGLRIPVQIGKLTRKAMIVVGNLDVGETQDVSEYGEMTTCGLTIDIVLFPDIVGKVDYTLEFLVTENNVSKWVRMPFTGLSISTMMTQRAAPFMKKPEDVATINLSKARTFVIVYDGYNNAFVESIISSSLASNYSETGEALPQEKNNKSVIFRITRIDQQFTYDCVIKDHLITIQDDAGNETHSLTLTVRAV